MKNNKLIARLAGGFRSGAELTLNASHWPETIDAPRQSKTYHPGGYEILVDRYVLHTEFNHLGNAAYVYKNTRRQELFNQ